MEGVRLTTFFSCSYWITMAVIQQLREGAVVEVTGRISATAYLVGSEPKASLNCHVVTIKIHHFSKGDDQKVSKQVVGVSGNGSLPF